MEGYVKNVAIMQTDWSHKYNAWKVPHTHLHTHAHNVWKQGWLHTYSQLIWQWRAVELRKPVSQCTSDQDKRGLWRNKINTCWGYDSYCTMNTKICSIEIVTNILFCWDKEQIVMVHTWMKPCHPYIRMTDFTLQMYMRWAACQSSTYSKLRD